MKLRVNNRPTVVLGARLMLRNLPYEAREAIKEHLTYENPKYKNAMAFSPWGYTTIPSELTYYDEFPDRSIRVPAGFDYSPYSINNVVDRRVKRKVEYPPFNLTLREDQKDLVDAYLKANKQSSLHGMIKFPTGKGKTIAGLYIAQALKQRTLVLVHKTDLLRGWKADIELCFGKDLKVGIIGNGKNSPGNEITLAMVQTLNHWTKEYLIELGEQYGLVIVDECHHCPATSYEVLNYFAARYKLGLSATPEREDGLTHLMHDYLGDFCYKYRKKSAKEETDILPVKVKYSTLSTYLDPVCALKPNSVGRKRWVIEDMLAPAKYELKQNERRYRAIPYELRPKLTFTEIENCVMKSKTFVGKVVEDIMREALNGKSCIMFLNQKQHCDLFYYKLIRAGLDESLVQIYNGDRTSKELEECLVNAESKKALVTITTYSKAKEGTNVKAWERGFIVGSTKNGVAVEQAVGRIRRIADNKEDAILYDYSLPRVLTINKHFAARCKRYTSLGFEICV